MLKTLSLIFIIIIVLNLCCIVELELQLQKDNNPQKLNARRSQESLSSVTTQKAGEASQLNGELSARLSCLESKQSDTIKQVSETSNLATTAFELAKRWEENGKELNDRVERLEIKDGGFILKLNTVF